MADDARRSSLRICKLFIMYKSELMGDRLCASIGSINLPGLPRPFKRVSVRAVCAAVSSTTSISIRAIYTHEDNFVPSVYRQLHRIFCFARLVTYERSIERTAVFASFSLCLSVSLSICAVFTYRKTACKRWLR